MTKLKVALPAAIGLVCLLAAPSARSQDVSTVYDAVKSMNDQIVTQRVATDAATRIACTSPKLRRYFRRSLHLLQKRQWGLLRAALRDETIDLVGDAVYAAVRGAGGGLAEFLGPARLPGECSSDEVETIAADLARSDGERAWSDVEACSAESKSGDVACDFALAMRAMLRGNADEARGELVRALFAPEGRLATELAAWVKDDGAKKEGAEDALGEAFKAIDAARGARLLRALRPLKGGPGDMLASLDAFRSIATSGPDVCPSGPVHAEPCARLRRIDELTRPRGDLRDVAILAARGDTRELAVRTMSQVFARESVTLETCRPGNAPYGAFFTAFVAYVLDEQTTGDQLTLSREAFRSAAVDVARCTNAAGIERVSRHELGRFSLDIVPTFALRFSWNQAYRNELGSDGYRFTPSLDVLTARIRITGRDSIYYSGIELSLVDLLAPVSELALRRVDVAYDDQSNLWLELLRPRIDVNFGLPMATEHVFVSAGTSVRTAAPFAGARGDAGATPTPGHFTYLALGSGDARVSSTYAAFFELNLAVKYIF
jgi:hypothetical protein